jgi:C-terminal processing protease CtpA/Prc
MKPVEDIKKLIRKLDIEPSAEMYERTLADAVTVHFRERQIRISRFLPFGAVAAGFVLLSLLGAIALHESATPVYAVEQTVAAIKKVPVVHILGRDWEDKRIEMWIKVNPDTGLMDSCHIRYPDDDRSVVSTPRNTYDHDGRTNTVRIKDGPSVASIFSLGDFFQGMERLAETLDGQITYCEVTDPGTKRSMLELKLSGPQTEIVCLIDPKTKLPISISVPRGGRFGPYDVLKNATEIHYSDVPPKGLFDFTIPTGANVSVETSEDPLGSLPGEVLRYCGEFHLKTLQEMAQPKGIPVNTRLYFVDSEFNLRSGGFIGIRNDSNEVWKDEIDVGNFDVSNIAIFDATSGKKQQIRLVQHRQSPPGRFRLHWRLEEALHPGQTRYGIYWVNEAKPLQKGSTGETYPVSMSNRFGCEAIENFMLIVPKGMNVNDCSRKYESDGEVDDYRVYAWQRHLPAELIVNQVDVVLSRPSGGWLESNAWMIIGPFDNTADTGFETPYPPEKEIDFSGECAGKEGTVKWFRPKRARIDGLVDLAALIGRRDWSVAYAVTSVHSPEARKMELRVGSDDDVRAWLNGELVLSRSADRGAVPDEDVVPVTLRKGENQLLLKVCNRLYSWGFYARVVDANVARYTPKPPPTSVTRQEAIEDLDVLVRQLKAKHPKPFAKVSEKDFSGEIERIKANLPEELPVKDFSLSLAALLALVGDDHTRHRDFSAFEQHVNNGGKVFPVKFRYKDNRMTIEAWTPEVSPARMKAGDSVSAVNGEPMESLLQRYGRYISVETDLQKWWTLEWAIEKYQVLLGDTRDQYTLQVRDDEGRTHSETLPAVKPWLEQYERSKSQAPRFHHQFYEDGKVCLFKLQTFNWDLRAELEAKANALVDEMKRNGTRIAILDLRGNSGGNSNMGAMVLVKMIDKPYGEWRPDPNHSWPVTLALLCDRSTYSAASFEAMCFKDHNMGIIAGEETGGRASFFGDVEHVTLPNSLLVCGIATRYFPRRAGYDDGRGVLPDLPLDVTLDDSVLVEKICACIREPGGKRADDTH